MRPTSRVLALPIVVPDDCGIEELWNEYQQVLLSQQSSKE